MNQARASGIKFTGEGGVKVKQFLDRMDQWFATQGDDLLGKTTQSKQARAAQIHLALPFHSAAYRFVMTLDKATRGEEELLRTALVNEFHDIEEETHAEEEMLSTMNSLRQGDREVFQYSHRVIRFLQRTPRGLDRFNRMFISNYLDGLSSAGLRELAISTFRRRDSSESPMEVVKGVMRLATQLKVRGYRKQGSRRYDDDEEEEDDDDDDSDEVPSSDEDDDDDDDDYYGHSRKARRKGKGAKGRGVSKRKGKRATSKERKTRKSSGEEAASKGELAELREMMHDLMQMQKATTTGKKEEAGRSGEDVIPLDTFAVGGGYGRYPYGQPNISHPTTRRSEYYPNRRNELLPPGAYQQDRRGGYQSAYHNGPQEMERMGFPTRSYFEDFSRRPTDTSRFAQASGQPGRRYPQLRSYENTQEAQPAVAPSGVPYYPPRPRICFHCQEEGHFRYQCPRLYQPPVMPRRDNLGPEYPDTPTQRAEHPAQIQDKPVSVIEIVSKSSALQGMKVREVTATAVEDSADLRMFVHQVREADIDDRCASDRSEEEDDEEDAVPVMAGERARRFSDLPPEFDGETGPASRRQRTTYGADEEAEEATTGKRKTKTPFPRAPRKPIRLMAGREKFDFVGAFRDSPVTGLNWGSFFDLAPSVK